MPPSVRSGRGLHVREYQGREPRKCTVASTSCGLDLLGLRDAPVIDLLLERLCLLPRAGDPIVLWGATLHAVLAFATLAYMRSRHPDMLPRLREFKVIALSASEAIAQQVVLFRFLAFLMKLEFLRSIDRVVVASCSTQFALLSTVVLVFVANGPCSK